VRSLGQRVDCLSVSQPLFVDRQYGVVITPCSLFSLADISKGALHLSLS
jgi:3-polyprenyl-4-hydroxybenzoate decarboxylase